MHKAGACGIVRPCPAVFVVECIAQRVIGFLPAGRRGIERLAGRQIDTRHQHVHMNASIRLGVLNGGPCHAISAQPGEGHALELVQRLLDLLRRRRIFFGPCNHARRIAPSEVQRIGYGGHLFGVTPEHGHISPFYALVVTLGEHIPGCLPCVACAVLQPLDVHHSPPSVRGSAPDTPGR